jgi:urease accessory protein
MSRVVLKTLISFCVLAPTAVLAHPGHGDSSSFMHGLVHPITGIDHVLAMTAVGLFSVRLGGRAAWMTPLTFLGAVAVAGALAMAGVSLPFAETGIVLSVIVLGLAVALSLNLPTLGATNSEPRQVGRLCGAGCILRWKPEGSADLHLRA